MPGLLPRRTKSHSATPAAFLIALLVATLSCADDAYVVLSIEDPEGLAASATALSYSVPGDPAFTRLELEGQGFPVTNTLIGQDGEERELWIAALGERNVALGRAVIQISFEAGRIGSATARLGAPCYEAADCDDGRYCNGAETCVGAICAAGEPPCPRSPFSCVDVACLESAADCEITPVHDRCEPLLDEGSGRLERTYCDVRVGCIPGDACEEEGEICPRLSACEWTRLCVASRCVPVYPLEVDDGSPCTVDYCDDELGPQHVADPRADGTPCTLLERQDGLCIDGSCQHSICGDGYLDLLEGEECDDGAANSDVEPNACRADCTEARCGDGVQDSGEECDDGNGVDTDPCLTTCVLNVCGDGVLNPSVEACDDGNELDSDACLSSCEENVCGDGLVKIGVEACDDGNLEDQDRCLSDCTPNLCGDGHLNPFDEECDDGDSNNLDSCLTTCEVNQCGDGFLNTGVEECDDGNQVLEDSCLPGCITNVCGDGVLDPLEEECDDGNAVNEDACLVGCVLNTCGDGHWNPLAEPCDDGNAVQEDACLVGCVLNTCGDGFVNPAAEACDDGDLDYTDDCVAFCATASCGDGFVWDGHEECDDGNTVQEDGCLNSCALNTCGDGFLNSAAEECDDGDSDDTNACVAGCLRASCGDTFVHAGVEECDDGNPDAQDACLPTCVANICGDGVRDLAAEDCDDGNTESLDGCAADCSRVVFCTDLGAPVEGGAPIALYATQSSYHLISVGTTDGVLHGIDGFTGEVRWRYDTSDSIRSMPSSTLDGVAVLSTDGVLHHLARGDESASGTLLWTFDTGQASSATGINFTFANNPHTYGVMSIDDTGTLHAVFDDGGPAAIGLNEDYPFTTGPLGVCDRCAPTLISNSGVRNGVLVGLDNKIWLWEFSTPCAPVSLTLGVGERVLDHPVFYGDGAAEFSEHDVGYAATSLNRIIQVGTSARGQSIDCADLVLDEIWSFPTGTTLSAAPIAIPAEMGIRDQDSRVIYYGGEDGRLCRLDTTTPPTAPTWCRDLGAPLRSSPALDATGQVYVGDAVGGVHQVDSLDGTPRWSVDLGEAIIGSPLLSRGLVYVTTASGQLCALERGGDEPSQQIWTRQGSGARGFGHGTCAASRRASTGLLSFLILLGLVLVLRRRR